MLVVEYRRRDFDAACAEWGDRLPILLRDRDVSVGGVDERWEWEPSLLAARQQLETRFERDLQELVGPERETCAPEAMDLALRDIADWLSWWPSVAVVVGVAALALTESGAAVPAVIGLIATATVLTWLASRDVEAES